MQTVEAIAASGFNSKLTDTLKGMNILDILRPRNAAAAGGKIWQLIKDALGNIDLSSMTEEEFVAKVDAIYDSLVAPAILGIGPVGVFLNPVLNAVVLSLADRFYDNHSKPKPA